MAKKNVLELGYEHEAVVIGIASNEMIWKLCWKLNQALQLNLATAEDDVTRVKGPSLYHDFETDATFDYLLFENNLKPSQGTKLARQFRFWLVAKAKREDAQLDSEDLRQRISGIDIVSLVHDISDEKDIKRLIP